MKNSRKSVLLTVRHAPGRATDQHAVELPDGTPVAGVASAVIANDECGSPVLTIRVRQFSVDAAAAEPTLYQWQDFGVLALPHYKS